MSKVPPFISYDYQPRYVTIFGEKTIMRHPSIRALAKDGTIWETSENENGQWHAWRKIG
jgi:hypothetical protein